MVASVGKELSWRDVSSTVWVGGYMNRYRANSRRDSEEEGSRFLQGLECDGERGLLGTSSNCIF